MPRDPTRKRAGKREKRRARAVVERLESGFNPESFQPSKSLSHFSFTYDDEVDADGSLGEHYALTAEPDTVRTTPSWKQRKRQSKEAKQRNWQSWQESQWEQPAGADWWTEPTSQSSSSASHAAATGHRSVSVSQVDRRPIGPGASKASSSRDDRDDLEWGDSGAPCEVDSSVSAQRRSAGKKARRVKYLGWRKTPQPSVIEGESEDNLPGLRAEDSDAEVTEISPRQSEEVDDENVGEEQPEAEPWLV